jgi:homoserine kinase type II
MALYTPLSNDELAAVAAGFGVARPERVVPEPKGSINTNYHLWAGGERYFLRLAEGKTDADVEFEASVLRFLETERFPAARLVPSADGASHVRVRGRQAMLFAYAEGEELAREEVTAAHCRSIGEQLGGLHALAASFAPDRKNPYGLERVGLWIEELEPDGGGDEAVKRALPMLREELDRAAGLPQAPRGLIHGDLFIDNALWIGDRVSAILDWEMSCVDAFAYDLAVTLNAWCYAGRFEPERIRALLSGYRSRAKLDGDTLRALYPQALYAALRYTASRIHAFHLAELGEDRLVWKDWSHYRDRLLALRRMQEAGFGELVGG